MATEQGMDPAFRSKLDALIAASRGSLYLTSGYRDNALQAKLYDAAVRKYGEANAGKWVAPPGHSNHERGLAADIGGDLGVLKQLAPQFGLELPMSWEPWHVEPVGLREHPATSPQAYTAGPPGTVNPTADPTINTRPETIFARLASALAGGDVYGQSVSDGSIGSDSAATAKADSGQTPAATTAASAASGGKGSVDPKALYQQLRAQGLDPAHAAALVAIAGRESNYNPSAHNGNAATGDNSFGLFQINKLNGMHSQWSDQELLSPEGSIAAAASLVKSGGLQPWGGYKGVPWQHDAALQTAVDASNGEVTLADLQGLH